MRDVRGARERRACGKQRAWQAATEGEHLASQPRSRPQCAAEELALAGVEWVDVRVDCGDPSTAEYKKMWMDFKPNLDSVMHFPNLPYLLDGEVAISQSNVILRHLGRKYGLMGEPSSLHLVDLVLDEMADFDKQVTSRCYSDPASLKPYCEKQLPGTLHAAPLLHEARRLQARAEVSQVLAKLPT